jgi:putative DNA methylase
MGRSAPTDSDPQQRRRQRRRCHAGALSDKSDAIRSLAYRLYTLCERKGWAQDARAYNELVTAWDAMQSAMADSGQRGENFNLDF